MLGRRLSVKVAVARGVLTTRTNLPSIDTKRLVRTSLSLILNGSVASPITVRRVKGVGMRNMFRGSGVTLIVSRFTPGGSVGSTRRYGYMHRFIYGGSVAGCFSMNRVKVRRTLLPRGKLAITKSIVVNTSSRAYACNTLNTFSANIKDASVTTNVTAKGT